MHGRMNGDWAEHVTCIVATAQLNHAATATPAAQQLHAVKQLLRT